MLIYIIVIIFIIILIIFLFSSKTLSPIPYFPSQPADLPLIIKALNLKNNQTVFDLGAGDGIVIFTAAKSSFQRKLNTKFVAVEINPVLILILHLRRFFHPNKKNVEIVFDDIFKINLSRLTMKQWSNVTIYLYISPWYLKKTISNIKNQTCLPADRYQKFSIVSYMYPIKNLEKKQKNIQGKNKIFVYN